MIKKIFYFIQALIIYFLFLIGFILGLKLSRIFFASLFSLLGPFFRSRKVIEKNLNIFLPNISIEKKNEIIGNMWRNYGKTFIEYIFLKNFKQSNNHIKIKNKNYLETTLLGNEPVIFISGHFANFELMAMHIEKSGFDLCAIYRPLNNIFINKIMEKIRKKYICKNQIKKGIGGIKHLINFTKKNYSTALMIDQRVSEGTLSKFFDKEAYTTTIPAQLAKKFNMPIIPVHIQRLDNLNYKIKINKPLHFKENSSIQYITDQLNMVLEEMVKINPNQWIWSHNRWK